MTNENRKAVRNRTKGFIMGFVIQDRLSFADEPFIYATKRDALDALKRLSPLFPTITFTILELQHYVKIPINGGKK